MTAEEWIREMYDPELLQNVYRGLFYPRIHSVVDLRHPDNRACYFCLESPPARYNYLHHGPNPNLLPRYPQRLKSRAAVARRLERELAKPGAVGL